MSSFIGGIIALVVGGGLATATVLGIVSSQTSAGNDPLSGGGNAETQVLDYGTNNQ